MKLLINSYVGLKYSQNEPNLRQINLMTRLMVLHVLKKSGLEKISCCDYIFLSGVKYNLNPIDFSNHW